MYEARSDTRKATRSPNSRACATRPSGTRLASPRVMRLEVAVLCAAIDLGAPHEADADGVHADPIRGVLVGERLREVDAGGAGQRGRQGPGGGRLAADHGDIDDLPAAPPLHVRDGEAAEADRPHHLEVEVGLPGGVVDGLERIGIGGPGIVEQDVDAAPAVGNRLDHGLDVRGARDVGGHGEHLASGGLPDLLGGPLQVVFAPGADADLHALRGQPLGGRPPHTVTASGDDCYFPLELEIERHVPPLRPWGVVAETCPDSTGVVGELAPLDDRPIIARRRAAGRGARATWATTTRGPDRR